MIQKGKIQVNLHINQQVLNFHATIDIDIQRRKKIEILERYSDMTHDSRKSHNMLSQNSVSVEIILKRR